MQIILVRHALSQLNAGIIKHQDMPNHKIPIVEPCGVNQALEVGRMFGRDFGKAFLSEALLYQSPYLRTRQTMKNLLIGAGFEEDKLPRVYEDPRLREVDFGYGDPETQRNKREHEGFFWYRMDGGESGADCFDRCATFLDSMMRQLKRKQKPEYKKAIDSDGIDYFHESGKINRDVVIVTHGLIIRCFVMRFMHLSVEQIDSIDNPANCSVITIGLKSKIENPQFVSGKWAVTGLKMR